MNHETDVTVESTANVLEHVHPVLRRWFLDSFDAPTLVQQRAWPLIAQRQHTLLLAPTGSGKTLAAFLMALDRIMFGAPPVGMQAVRVLYISPLKALGVDVERNLRSPLAGVRAVAQREGVSFHEPQIGVRSGDTPAADRQRLRRQPPDILITTPESLFLMLTSRAAETLQWVETVIIDEIHSLAATKRGTHLFVSLERLEQCRRQAGNHQPLQRIGLSATQRPLEEIARLLGGAVWTTTATGERQLQPRPVQIVQAGRSRQLDLRIEVPVDDMSQLGDRAVLEGSAAAGSLPSIWPAIHPRLVELIRQHRSTMIFVNSRRLAERLASAINDQAEQEIALAHHGSIAKATRRHIEDRLKQGTLPAIVATSSLELGIDMGAVELVIQIESPPSIASGIQRIGRSGHQVGGSSSGVIFPKYRGDLLACSAAAERMVRGDVEETFYPRNPLDVLAQQIVAITAEHETSVDELFDQVRCAAPFHELPRNSFESVLDLLAGRYPSDQFAELRPRLNWDRLSGRLTARKGAQRLAIANAGTIPDRGLYGVFLAGEGGSRVGELDEEMVFETHPGDIFLLGASSWRVMDITSDRVLVTPAPGEPGRMPFWRGDGPGRPLDFGRAIGHLTHRLIRMAPDEALTELTSLHGLDRRAANNLLAYLHDQAAATGEPPSDRTIVVETFLDEIGDWRVAVLSPFGARVHAPWATAVAARLRAEAGDEVDMMWSDDGMVFRLPASEEAPPTSWLFPAPDEIEEMVVRELGGTALFAGRFRENAARALLLPRRQPGRRTPLWMQRRRAADLLAVAARYPNFPLILETYRECLRDIFDLPGLKSILHEVQRQSIRVHTVQTSQASPFASSLLFNYTANFLYNGDTPLAERRAQTLALDHAQLAELLGTAELRELLCPEAVEQLALELQRLDRKHPPTDADGVQDLLRHLGDLSRDELAVRCDDHTVSSGELDAWIDQLERQRRTVRIRLAGDSRLVPAEEAARWRDAFGVVLPPGLPEAFLEVQGDPLLELVARYARTHVPFHPDDVAQRFGLGTAAAKLALDQLVAVGRLLEGEFLPGRRGREWTDPNVLRLLKRRSLAQLRKQVEPVEPSALARFLHGWQGIAEPRRGLDGLLDVVEQLQAVALPASVWEDEVLPRRVIDYRPADLDELAAAGEIVWQGIESLGADDGRIALFLTDHVGHLAAGAQETNHELAQAVYDQLAARGALFFDQIAAAVGGFPPDVLDALWQLVWAGKVTNDTLAPLRARRKPPRRGGRGRPRLGRFRSRRTRQLPGSEGRWALLLPAQATRPDATAQRLALVRQLIDRYGVLTREMVAAEGIRGGFAGVYPVLKAMEEAGKLRRGYFVAGLGATQFAAPGAEDRLRQTPRDDDGQHAHHAWVLAATDPGNPYGAALPWPKAVTNEPFRPQRTAGARVVLSDGQLVGYLARGGQHLLTFLPEEEAERARHERGLVEALVEQAGREPLLLVKLDGVPAAAAPLAGPLMQAGFMSLSRGLLHRGATRASHG
jgi:ATP-dependent Lhr-like helicase